MFDSTWPSADKKSSSEPPWLLKFRSSKRFIIFAVLLAAFTDVFLYGVIVPVLPNAITKRAGVAPEDRQGVISLLLATYGGFLFISAGPMGVIADNTASRRGPLLCGLLSLAAATGLLCIGTSVPILVVGRMFQGISAALVWTVGVALLLDTVEKDAVGQAMGYVSLGMTAGTVLGPLLGGLVYHAGGYYAVFGMAFGVILVDIILRSTLIEKKVAAKWKISDESRNYGTMQTNGSSARDEPAPDRKVGSNPSSEEEERHGEGNSKQQKTRIESLLDRLPPIVYLLTYPRIWVNLVCAFIAATILVSFDAVLPIYTNETFGWNSAYQGLIFLATFVPFLFAPVVGWLADRFNPRAVSVVGFLISTPACILLRLVNKNEDTDKILLWVLLFFIGLSQTTITTPLMVDLIGYTRKEEKFNKRLQGSKGTTAQINALYNSAFSAGTLCGPGAAAAMKISCGWALMNLVYGVASAVMAVVLLSAMVYEAKSAKDLIFREPVTDEESE